MNVLDVRLLINSITIALQLNTEFESKIYLKIHYSNI